MKFILEDHKDIGAVMYCPDEESAEIFAKYLHKNGRRWSNGKSYDEATHWFPSFPPDGIYYRFNAGIHGNIAPSGSIINFDCYEWDEIEPFEEESLITSFLMEFHKFLKERSDNR